MDEDFDVYIYKCQMFIEIMVKNKHWSGLRQIDIQNWFSNFNNLDSKDRAVIYKLLTNIIYFSEDDITSILKDGINNRLFKKKILEQQIASSFQLSPQALLNIAQQELDQACFVPLLDRNAPYESGNAITRILVQQGLIGQRQSSFLNNELINSIQADNYKYIVIVDDCLGSGDQFKGYFNQSIEINDNNKLLRDVFKSIGITVIYFVLFGYKHTIDILSHEFPDINICCSKILDDNLRVFSNDSYIWDDVKEREYAYTLIKRIAEERGIELLGFNQLDFAFFMHKNIPDWSLPLFWRENADWQYLLRRKNSNDFTI